MKEKNLAKPQSHMAIKNSTYSMAFITIWLIAIKALCGFTWIFKIYPCI